MPDLGWVAFDPANGICATDAHVRVAVGLDYLGAAPVRGSRQGGGDEALEVAVKRRSGRTAGAELEHDPEKWEPVFGPYSRKMPIRSPGRRGSAASAVR